MLGSFESVQWNVWAHRLDLGLYPHPKEFRGNGVRTHVNSKRKIPSTGRLRGGSNPRTCITQDCEPNTLPTELCRPPNRNDIGKTPTKYQCKFQVEYLYKVLPTDRQYIGIVFPSVLSAPSKHNCMNSSCTCRFSLPPFADLNCNASQKMFAL